MHALEREHLTLKSNWLHAQMQTAYSELIPTTATSITVLANKFPPPRLPHDLRQRSLLR